MHARNFMPMGVMNAPMMFQKTMCGIIGDLDVVVYIDDVCIFSTNVE